MNRLTGLTAGRLMYDHIIGTGGIGSGIVFSLKGNHTLGRNESRLARLEPFLDYCKLHIIMHYLSVLLGADPAGRFRSFPIGAVGTDDAGSRLLAMMKQAGMNMEYVRRDTQCSTLYSVCYQYPDHSGGNITADNSASHKVTPRNIDDFFEDFRPGQRDGMTLALPEVPVETRIRLLRRGRELGYLNAASVLSSEAEEFKSNGGLGLTDLLAVNMEEARSMADVADESAGADFIVHRAMELFSRSNPGIMVLITDGERGNYCIQGGKVEYSGIIPAEVISTAGAGDAFLAGTMAGMCCGLPLQRGGSAGTLTETPLRSAVDLGVLLASFSVTSPDTIHLGVNAFALLDYARSKGLTLSEEFRAVFRECTQPSPDP